jgi:glutathione peroxidase
MGAHMSVYDIPLRTIDGRETSLREYAGRALLIVNVASECGYTPQYTGLEELQREYGPAGLTVLGFPCNQFGSQEPGTNDEIVAFCSTYGVTFPLFDKIEVNGPGRHPLYAQLAQQPFSDGHGAGDDITWNFEKFVVSSAGEVVGRFAHRVEPDDPDLLIALKAQLA